MIRKVRVEDLEVGDRVLWADANTRHYMCANEQCPERTQVLEVVELDYGGYEDKILYTTVGNDPKELPLFHDSRCYAYVIPKSNEERRREVDMKHTCARCGKRVGNHRRDSWQCPGPIGYGKLGFLPADESWIKSAMGYDFFAELGL